VQAPILFGDYYLIEKVAMGGMAEVFKGVNYGAEGFERICALKRVLPHIAEDQDFIDMFIDEAKIAAQLQHPNISQVYHLGQVDHAYFIAMEFISGKDLRSIFDRAKARNIQLDIGLCVYVVKEICEALDYAHQKRNANMEPLHIIHRDISLQNILLSYDGSVKLIDFGIAKAANKINKTQVGILKGKFSYMSPEQAKGQQIDQRADLFALGIVLYELLTLERCFFGESDFSTIERVRNVDYTPPKKIRREIPTSLEKIISKALSYDIQKRYQSAADFKEALDGFLRREGDQYQKNQQQRTSAQKFMFMVFRAEIEKEQNKMADFHRYAMQNIPEAQKAVSLQAKQLNYLPTTTKYPKSLSDSPEKTNIVSLRSRLFFLLMIAVLTVLISLSYLKYITLNQSIVTISLVNTTSNANITMKSIDGTIQYQSIHHLIVQDIPSGKYLIEINSNGYYPFTQEIEIQAGDKIDFPIQLQRNENLNLVSFYSTPTSAQIYINQKEVGNSPLKIYLEKGNYQLSVQKNGYFNDSSNFKVQQSEQTIDCQLIPNEVELSLFPNTQQIQFSYQHPNFTKDWEYMGMGQVKKRIPNDGLSKIKAQGNQLKTVIYQIGQYQSAIVNESIKLDSGTNNTLPINIDLGTKITPQPNQPSNTNALPLSSTELAIPTVNPIDLLPPPSLNPTINLSENTIPIPTPTPILTPAITKPSSPQPQPKPKIIPPKKTQPRVVVPAQTEDQEEEVKPKAKAVAVEEDKQPGLLKLTSKPPAEVFYQGQSLGWTPIVNYSMPEGVHRMKLKWNDGALDQDITVVIEPGKETLRKYVRP
jgi:serine/threonine protein kinase